MPNELEEFKQKLLAHIADELAAIGAGEVEEIKKALSEPIVFHDGWVERSQPEEPPRGGPVHFVLRGTIRDAAYRDGNTVGHVVGAGPAISKKTGRDYAVPLETGEGTRDDKPGEQRDGPRPYMGPSLNRAEKKMIAMPEKLKQFHG